VKDKIKRKKRYKETKVREGVNTIRREGHRK
jgi:hypothetical protein